ncbi:pyridoxal phosphate-dependent transferase [Polychytrium aggregatum]|uniref:pyridoxal phosphate-dependent transferase n=1 Tax=Polychytrium aggregatum TaxID=110093 RepID=UPI0022FE8C69|nr:pyridoxal phosphate-dependent transferase [Polychytrium aggregatum]KAI9199828.1 pyridoxal phosphate-dependent transferase [Polychytrium aggregatum]
MQSRAHYDFRSDTVTVPTKEMALDMIQCEVGDDVFEEDPTINALQDYMADITGHEAALFCATATMTNQVAIRSHLQVPPYSVVCDRRAHVFRYEAGGISFHSGAAVNPVLPKEGYHHLTADVIEANMVLDDDVHFAPTQLVCIENTLNGEIFPLDEIKKISQLVRSKGVRIHLDGARLWNASVATGISIKEYCQQFDSVSLCLSKGLGAPVGSVLVGSKTFIKKARHIRKVFGGGWRQAGILARAGLYAIEHHLPNLKRDHEHAKILANGLVELGFVLVHQPHTNMVFFDGKNVKLPGGDGFTMEKYSAMLARHGIKVFGGETSSGRLVLHHQIPTEAVELLLRVTREWIQTGN